jgi:hypothetical protein
MRFRRWTVLLILILWLAGIFGGLSALWSYAVTPEKESTLLADWPSSSLFQQKLVPDVPD